VVDVPRLVLELRLGVDVLVRLEQFKENVCSKQFKETCG
jgi:hypothetical protein